MKSFFNDATPRKTVTHGEATFDLPIFYHRDDAFALYYTADFESVKAAMPSGNLHPLLLPGGKAVVAFCAFNYIDTSIGPYGEIAVALPARSVRSAGCEAGAVTRMACCSSRAVKMSSGDSTSTPHSCWRATSR